MLSIKLQIKFENKTCLKGCIKLNQWDQYILQEVKVQLNCRVGE